MGDVRTISSIKTSHVSRRLDLVPSGTRKARSAVLVLTSIAQKEQWVMTRGIFGDVG
jgi:hypothetical protein